MRILNLLCVGIYFLTGSYAPAVERPPVHAHERPTLVHTRDPRPDFVPRPLYDNYTEYRAAYNRPRFSGGLLAYGMSRTSMEAMSWKENYCAGRYDQHHMPPTVKGYFYPKPWEALNVGARPDFAQSKSNLQRLPTTPESDLDESVSIYKSKADLEKAENVPAESDSPQNTVVPSPSDK